MSGFFLKILNMGISASWVVIVVLLARLLLKKAPKWITVLLWAVVAVRLICPVSVESAISLMPSPQTIRKAPDAPRPDIASGFAVLDDPANDYLWSRYFEGVTRPAGHFESIMTLLAFLWIAGILALLIYTLISYLRVRNKIATAVLLRGNIYQGEGVTSPFVFGLIQPKIYLPFCIAEQDAEHVIAHECAHIRRKDYIWKPLGFLLLTLHWFHPLIWLGYILFCRDMELACDEKVVKALDRQGRADYSQALLTCSISKGKLAACPIAFGEVGIKPRIRSILNYRKPAFWVLIAAAVVSLVLAVCFLTNPVEEENMGVQHISAVRVDSDTVELKLQYTYSTGGYSIRSVSEEEGEYSGDGIVDYDGSLGKYRILIKLGDAGFSEKLAEQYPAGKAVELENAPVKMRFKCVYPSDHGVFLYVGFDAPVSIDPVESARMNLFGGVIRIPITQKATQ